MTSYEILVPSIPHFLCRCLCNVCKNNNLDNKEIAEDNHSDLLLLTNSPFLIGFKIGIQLSTKFSQNCIKCLY